MLVKSAYVLDFLHVVYFSDETEDEDVNKEYVEETNRDAVMIGAAKLVANDVVPKVSIHAFRFSPMRYFT